MNKNSRTIIGGLAALGACFLLAWGMIFCGIAAMGIAYLIRLPPVR